MGRLPKGKEALSLYVYPQTKIRLKQIQSIYFIQKNEKSLSQIADTAITFLYYIIYFSLENNFRNKIKKIITFKPILDLTNSLKNRKNEYREILKPIQ